MANEATYLTIRLITYSSIIKASELAGEVELDMLEVLLCH